MRQLFFILTFILTFTITKKAFDNAVYSVLFNGQRLVYIAF